MKITKILTAMALFISMIFAGGVKEEPKVDPTERTKPEVTVEETKPYEEVKTEPKEETKPYEEVPDTKPYEEVPDTKTSVKGEKPIDATFSEIKNLFE